MSREQIWIGNDHGGYELKCEIARLLSSKRLQYHDAGCHSTEIVRYPYYAALVCEALLTGHANRGILICSTGIGMSIVANRYRGIRASLCNSAYTGRVTRAHNDSNVLCLGGKTLGLFEALDTVEAWLAAPYEGGRHDISLGLLADAEQVLGTGRLWRPNDPMDHPQPAGEPTEEVVR